MDARILEGWLIREVRPELNRSCDLGPTPSNGSRCGACREGWTEPGRCLEVAVDVAGVTEDLRPEDVGTLPNEPGAYIITTQSGQRYVGSSRSLRSRVRAHLEPAKDPNVTEPVRSVRCYLTHQVADAPIVEYWLIRDLRPELNRETRPDASTWKEGSTDALLAGAAPELREVMDVLSTRICRLPGVKEVARRKWLTYQLSAMRNFCAVKAMKSSLQVDLKVDKTRFFDPTGLSRPVTPTQAWNFNRRIEVSTIDHASAAMALIRQAYEFLGGAC